MLLRGDIGGADDLNLLGGVNQEQRDREALVKAQAIIDQLTLEVAYSDRLIPDKTNAQDPCSICFEEFSEGQVVRQINFCKHLFHPKCIEEWIKRKCPDSGIANCPLCKHELIVL